MKENFCPYVEKGFRAHIGFINGKIFSTYKPCCNMHRDLLDDDQKELLEIDENNIRSFVDNRHRRYFQNHFKKNNYLHKACLNCDLAEKSGQLSQRLLAQNDDFDSHDIYKLDITLSNICNLACPFCNSFASSLIDKTSKKYDMDDLPSHWSPLQKDYNLDSEKATKLLSKILDEFTVKHLKFVGGEPFLKGNWETIENLLNKNYLKNTDLHIITNGTCISQSKLKTLEKASFVELGISVDSIGENYNFIRWPHTWDKMNEKLDELAKNLPSNTEVYITALLNIFNFELIEDIRSVLNAKGFNVNFEPDLKPDDSPLHISNLPMEIIETVCNKTDQNLAEKIKTYVKNGKTSSENKIVHDVKFFVNQRNEQLSQILGKKTHSWLFSLDSSLS